MKNFITSFFLFLFVAVLLVGCVSKKPVTTTNVESISPPTPVPAPTSSYQAALQQAIQEKKLVLLDFTGSDWCGWCQRLKKETFDQEAFKEYAAKNLVFVEVDFPQTKELPAALQAQNQELASKYHVTGFPNLVLLDAQGNLLAQKSGYLAGGPEALIAWIKKNAGKE